MVGPSLILLISGSRKIGKSIFHGLKAFYIKSFGQLYIKFGLIHRVGRFVTTKLFFILQK